MQGRGRTVHGATANMLDQKIWRLLFYSLFISRIVSEDGTGSVSPFSTSVVIITVT
jgi:hypothetical protein